MSLYFDTILNSKDVIDVCNNAAMIKEFTLTRQFLMRDLDITARVFHHWASKGLVDIRPKKNDHNHEFSFVDLIWYSIVKELREFGFSLEKIKVVHDTLMQKFSWARLIDTLTEKDKAEMLAAIDLTPGFEGQEKEIYELKRKGLYERELFTGKNELVINFLYLLIYTFLTSRSNVWIYVDSNGNVIPSVENTMDKAKLSKQMEEFSFDMDSYLSISLMKFFRKFVQNPDHLNFVKDNNILNENEQYILSLIREGKAQSITIKFEKQKPSIIEITKEQKIHAESRVSDVLLRKGYQDVTIKTQNGNIVYTNITTKKQLK